MEVPSYNIKPSKIVQPTVIIGWQFSGYNLQ